MVELCSNCSELCVRISIEDMKTLKEKGYEVIGEKHTKEKSYLDELSIITPNKEKISFRENDSLTGTDVVMIGDYDNDHYYLLKEVSDLLGKEVQGHDGGGTFAYEEWLETYEKESRLSELDLLIKKNKELIKEQKKIKSELNGTHK